MAGFLISDLLCCPKNQITYHILILAVQFLFNLGNAEMEIQNACLLSSLIYFTETCDRRCKAVSVYHSKSLWFLCGIFCSHEKCPCLLTVGVSASCMSKVVQHPHVLNRSGFFEKPT